MKNYFKKALSFSHVVVGVTLSALLTSMVIYATTLTKPNTFNAGDVISAAQVNENFDVLYEEVNSIVNKNGFAVYFTSGQTYSITAGVWNDFTPTSIILHNDGAFNTSTFSYTVPVTGIYRLTESVTFSGLGMVNIKRYVNSVPWATVGRMTAGDVIMWEVGSTSDTGTATLNAESYIYLERLF